MQNVDDVISAFREKFDAPATAVARAPGRVEVLGNHTDYNDGFILAAAIDRDIVVAGRARPDAPEARVHSANYAEDAAFRPDAIAKTEKPFWLNYVMGVVDQLRQAGHPVAAFDAVVAGDVPLGAGLSSSAAFEMAVGSLLQALFDFTIPPLELARLGQRVENLFVGVQSGLLDQYTSAMGREDRLVYMDCRAPENGDTFPLGHDAALILANSGATHALADGAYNRLRESCFAAARHFAERIAAVDPSRTITHLRDVTEDDLARYADGLSDADFRRARHIVTENARVLRGVDALRRGDLATMGACMTASHASSRDDFGNSCVELDVLVDLATALPGCYGARLSGGGFGGCTVNLVAAEQAKDFVDVLTRQYRERTGIDATVYVCRAADGASGRRLD